jgi:hypothetical protein
MYRYHVTDATEIESGRVCRPLIHITLDLLDVYLATSNPASTILPRALPLSISV